MTHNAEAAVSPIRYPAPGRGISLSPRAAVYLSPADLLSGPLARGVVAAGRARFLGGGERAFCCVYLAARAEAKVSVYRLAVAEAENLHPEADAALAALAAPLPDFAGLTMDRPRVMGIVNVTPDSFSDGGERFDRKTAVQAGLAMAGAGADIIDVGGESTRPGAEAVSPDEEIRRVVPVIRDLAERGLCVSVDTRHAAVMAAALAAGARIVNDIAALADPGAVAAVRDAGAAAVLMHMQGEPRTMQSAPSYAYAPLDVYDGLKGRLEACLAAGIRRENLCVDPGIGFGKTLEHNLSILRWLALYRALGVPVLLGASRKRLIAAACGDVPPKARLPGSLAIALAGVHAGVNIVRVHDVAETVQAIRMQEAVDHAE